MIFCYFSASSFHSNEKGKTATDGLALPQATSGPLDSVTTIINLDPHSGVLSFPDVIYCQLWARIELGGLWTLLIYTVSFYYYGLIIIGL